MGEREVRTPLLVGPPAVVLERLDGFVRRFLVRHAAETGLPSRHVAALLRERPDADTLRAAAILLGRPGPPAFERSAADAADVEILARALVEPEKVRPEVLALALSRFLAAGPQDRLPLLQALRGLEAPPPSLLLSIGRCGNPEDVADLRLYLESETVRLRFAAAAAAAALGDGDAAASLEEVIAKGAPRLGREAVTSLARVGPVGRVGALLLEAMGHSDSDVSIPAAVALMEGGVPAGLQGFVDLAREARVPVSLAPAVRALPPGPGNASLLGFFLFFSPDLDAALEAALALAREKSPIVGSLCRFALDRGGLPETCLAAHALVALEAKEVPLGLLGVRLDRAKGEEERAVAAFAIGELGGVEAAEALVRRLPAGDPAAAAALLGAAGAR